METLVPVIIEDFEIGDRLYRQNNDDGEVVFGRVEEVHRDFLNVRLDNGPFFEVSIDLFKDDDTGEKKYVRWWSKCLDLSSLEVGSTLSCLDALNERHYSRVIAFVLGDYITLEHRTPGMGLPYQHTYLESSKPLDYQLRNFELEG